jgi:hypothetical protein
VQLIRAAWAVITPHDSQRKLHHGRGWNSGNVRVYTHGPGFRVDADLESTLLFILETDLDPML